MRLFAALAAALASTVLAVFTDEAFKVDFHHALLGLPEVSNTVFHPPFPGTKGSLIYTLSDKGVLGAVNPKDGSLVWRQTLSSDLQSGGVLKPAHSHDTMVAAVNDTVSTWSAGDGRLGWQKIFADHEVKDLQLLEKGTSPPDVLVLLAGMSNFIVRLDGTTGQEKWRTIDSNSDLPLKLSISTKASNYLSMSSGILKGFKIRATRLDPEDGKLSTSKILSSESGGAENVAYAGQPSLSAIVWSSPGSSTLRINLLEHRDAIKFNVAASDKPVETIAVALSEKPDAPPHFLVHYQTEDEHWADVFHADPSKGTVKRAYSLAKASGAGAFTSTFVDGKVYFVRITQTETSITSSTSADVLATFPISSFGAQGISNTETVVPQHAVSDVVVKGDGTFAIRSAVLLDSGDWSLIRNGAKVWVRPESLASITEAAFGFLQTPDNVPVQDLKLEERVDPLSAFIHRIKRHAQDWRYFSEIAQSLPDLLKVWLENFVTPGAGADSKHQSFGFKKLVLARTAHGRLVALQHGDQGRLLFNVKDEVPFVPLSSVVALYAESASRGGNVPWKDLIPDNAQVLIDSQDPNKPTSNVFYSLRDGKLVGHERDHKAQQSKKDEKATRELWTFSPTSGQEIVDVSSRLAHEPVASIGKALGDRRVLYKYLNPNLVSVTTINAAAQSASLYLLDAITGTVLHSAHHANVDTTRPITSAVSENWLAYSFVTLMKTATSSLSEQDSYSSGAQLVISELYESMEPNSRGPFGQGDKNMSTALPSFSPSLSLPHVVSSAFVITEEISAMAVTQTGQGITSRQLIASLPSLNAIFALPRQLLDPRRPVGKEPTNAQMQEEGLVRYAPAVDFDPKFSLSHTREVVGVKKMLTTPSAMESTSLIFAYGLDVFGTRVAPSFAFDILGASFNKVQLGLTIVCLVSGTLGVAPLVKRRMVDQLWTAPT